MYMKKLALTSFGLSLVVPVLVLAQTPDFTYPQAVIDRGYLWLNMAITVIMILITVFFLYSVLRYVMEKDPKNLPDRRKTMIAGLIGLFVAVSAWGIIRIFRRTTGTDGASSFTLVCPPGQHQVGNFCTY